MRKFGVEEELLLVDAATLQWSPRSRHDVWRPLVQSFAWHHFGVRSPRMLLPSGNP